jgi:hypothetical protein
MFFGLRFMVPVNTKIAQNLSTCSVNLAMHLKTNSFRCLPAHACYHWNAALDAFFWFVCLKPRSLSVQKLTNAF